MSDAAAREIDQARAARNAGHREDSLAGYRRAAEMARAAGDLAIEAHALRHVSDLARELGDADTALSAGNAALAYYRGTTPESLEHANAERVVALAWTSLASTEAAEPHWRTARAIYERLDIVAGVAECQRYLDR